MSKIDTSARAETTRRHTQGQGSLGGCALSLTGGAGGMCNTSQLQRSGLCSNLLRQRRSAMIDCNCDDAMGAIPWGHDCISQEELYKAIQIESFAFPMRRQQIFLYIRHSRQQAVPRSKFLPERHCWFSLGCQSHRSAMSCGPDDVFHVVLRTYTKPVPRLDFETI